MLLVGALRLTEGRDKCRTTPPTMHADTGLLTARAPIHQPVNRHCSICWMGRMQRYPMLGYVLASTTWLWKADASYGHHISDCLPQDPRVESSQQNSVSQYAVRAICVLVANLPSTRSRAAKVSSLPIKGYTSSRCMTTHLQIYR